MSARPPSAELPIVVRVALARLPPALQGVFAEVFAAVGPLLAVEAAEATAAETAAAVAVEGATGEIARSRRVIAALERLDAREQDHLRVTLDELEAIAEGGAGLDSLARRLGVGSVFETQEHFDAFMEDDAQSLTLGPIAMAVRADDDARLSRIATRSESSPLAYDSAGQTPDPLILNQAAGAGHWVKTPTGRAVLLGDGSAVEVDDRTVRRVEHLADVRSPHVLVLSRWSSTKPSQLVDNATAGLASCLAARKASGPAPEDFPAWLTVGVTGAAAADGTPLLQLMQLAKALTKLERADQAAAPLLQLAFEVARLRTSFAPAGPPAATEPFIDVGRVRWCELSQRPVVWLPICSDDPDAVGGPDRPWTTDIPAAGATWHSASPALRMDPQWSARLVVVPGDSTVWCLDAGGSWWTLDVDYEAIVLARTSHRDIWSDAMSFLHEQMPVQVAAATARAAAADERTSRKPEVGPEKAPAPHAPPKRFSREWVLQHASNYRYADDSAAVAAGSAAARRGHYTRDEFLVVVRWKSQRVVPLAEGNTSHAIESHTRAALAAADELTRVAELVSLQGVGVPVASALLHFTDPEKFPILDFRALASLGDLRRRTTYTNESWVSYLQRCQALADEIGVSVRDLDKALWQASKDGDQSR
jgi:hypothetical protein